MSPLQESEGCAALDGAATASQGTTRLPPPPTAVSGKCPAIEFEYLHGEVEPSELTSSDRPIEIPTASAQKGLHRDMSAMDDHFQA